MAQGSVILVKTSVDIAAVKDIFTEYIRYIEDYLGQSIGFQDTTGEMQSFPDYYKALFIAKVDGTPVGACGIKAFAPDIAELKRLYVRPDGRGHNFGLRLTEAALAYSRAAGFAQVYLDTDRGLTHANTIYEGLGFKDIDRYYDNPMGCSRYMALAL